MANFIRMALAFDGPLPGYEPPAPVVTFPHLRRQESKVLERHMILAIEQGDEEYVKACRAELASRELSEPKEAA